MTKRMAFGLALVSAMLPFSLAGAGLDGSKPLLCAVTEAIECGFDGTCTRGTAESINLPQFVRVDVKAKQLKEHGGERATAIGTIKLSEGRLVLQGLDSERPWTLSISEETGKMSATATGQEVGFVIFGVCTEF
jgi:hypothetical protein